MKPFRRKEVRERVPKILPAECLGEQCVNFAGVSCNAYEDLMQAGGNIDKKGEPPLKDAATYALYGSICTGGEGEMIVAARAEVFDRQVDPMMLVELANGCGDVPLTIQNLSE